MRPVVRSGFLVVVFCLWSRIVVESKTSGEGKQGIGDAWIKSEKVFLRGEPANVIITCGGAVQVHHCQFSWFSREGDAPTGPLISLNKHDTNATYWAVDEESVNHTVRLVREGCELVIGYDSFEETVVGCRVGANWPEWKYATTHLHANERGLLPVNVSPRNLFVFPGQAVTLTCNASAPLDTCRVSTPSSGGWLDLDSGGAVGRYRYHGAGLDRGECGVTVDNVTAEDHGPYSCLVTTPTARVQRTIKVAAATPPQNDPYIELKYFKGNPGRPMRATCRHDGTSNPPPTITWTLDDEAAPGMASYYDDVTPTGGYWRWPWIDADHKESVAVSRSDEGKLLRCLVGHVALPRPRVSAPIEISFEYPPLETDFMIQYEKGVTLKATCKTGRSRPVANIMWLLDDRILRQDGDHDGDDDDADDAVSQTLYVKLKPRDNGKMFRCIVSHPALVQPIEKSERVWYKPLDPLPTRKGYEVVALPGNDANISCMTPGMNTKYLPPVETCSFKLFNREETAYFHPSAQPRSNRTGYRFLGGPVETGGCGLTLERVTEADNGRVLCRMEANGDILYKRYIDVVVAHPPSPPVLHVWYDGPNLKATCSVGPSRPVASIVWKLDNNTIRQESGDDYEDDHAHKVCRSVLVKGSITQTMVWRLEPEDDGKMLRCVMSHPSLDQPIEDSHEILL